jgi:hypothetical protein
MLAKIHIVKGQVKTAKMWYARLRKDLVYGHYARSMLRRLDEGDSCAGVPNLYFQKSIARNRDTCPVEINIKDVCAELIERNSNNRMALDYLLSICLLQGDLPSFVNYMPRLPEAGYAQVPRHWAEALALYADMDPGFKPIAALLVPPDIARFGADFKRDIAVIRKNMPAATDEASFREQASDRLWHAYGSTYFYYFYFLMPVAKQ